MSAQKRKVDLEKEIRDLQERFDMVCDDYVRLKEEQIRDAEKIRYMNDFIVFKNLEDEFIYFKENAHEDQDADLPFPKLIL